jgi:hypothetical protein
MAGTNAAGYRVASTILLGMLASAAVGATAFAQAGATGGTIGKTDKSVSGGGDQPAPELRSTAPARPRGADKKPSSDEKGTRGQKVFVNPTIKGIRVDGCMKWGPVDCGAPAADHWCRSKGFEHAIEFSTEKVHPTIFQDPQSSVRVCDYFFCGAFNRIVCG